MLVRIEPISKEHAKYSWHLRQNEEVWKYMKCDSPFPSTLESEEDYYEKMTHDRWDKMFAIIADEEFVGCVKLKNIGNGAAELSYYVLRTDIWGRGIGYKATMECMKYAFEELGLDLVYRYVNPKNKGSWSIAMKQKCVRVGISLINPDVERLETTKTKWKDILKKSI